MRGFWKRLSAGVALVFFMLPGCAALAQGAVQQSGAVVPFHTSGWLSNGVVGDGGSPSSPFLNSLGLFNGSNCPLGISSQTSPGVSSSPYSQFTVCQTPTATILNFQGVNGQANPSVFFNIGGVLYPVTGGGGGGGSGTVTSLTSGTGIALAPSTITTTGAVAIDTAVVPTKAGTNIFSGSNTFSGAFTAPLCTGSAIGLVPTGGTSSNFLRGDCTWASPAGAGTVTSVAASGGTTGLTFTGTPITSAGTLTVAGTLVPANGGTGVTTVPTNGQIPIGNGTTYTAHTLTAGSNVTITNTSGNVTIAAAGGSGYATVFDVVATYNGDPTGANDNTAAYNAAKAACAAGGRGGIILFVGGTYKFTSQITNAASGCSIAGVGRAATTLKPTGISGDFLTSSCGGASATGVSGLHILNGGSWTSGFAVNMQCSWGWVDDSWIDSTPQAIHITNGSDSHVENTLMNDMTSSPVVLCDNASGAVFGSRWRNDTVTYFSGNTTATAFQQGAGCNSLIFQNVDTQFGNACLNVVNGAGLFTVLDDFECDHSQIGITVSGGSGFQMVNSFLGSTLSSDGLTFNSTFASFANISNTQIRDNTAFGILDNAPNATIQVTGGVISGNTSGNIAVGANVNHFQFTGPNMDVPGDPTAAYGVFIATGTSNYYNVTGVLCGSNTTVCVSDGGSGAKKFVSGNVGP